MGQPSHVSPSGYEDWRINKGMRKMKRFDERDPGLILRAMATALLIMPFVALLIAALCPWVRKHELIDLEKGPLLALPRWEQRYLQAHRWPISSPVGRLELAPIARSSLLACYLLPRKSGRVRDRGYWRPTILLLSGVDHVQTK